MLFISISLYYFLRFFKYGTVKNYHFAIIAFCCSSAFLIKPNFLALWMVGYLFIFIMWLKKREIRKIITVSVISIAVFIGVCLPFVFYFIYTDSWLDFKFAFWDFNKAYSENISFFGIAINTCKRLWFEPVARTPFQVFLFLFFVGAIINFKQLQYKIETWFFIATIILTGVLISIGNYVFTHYLLLFIPLFAFPFATVYHFIKKNFAAHPKWVYSFFAVLLFCGFVNDLKSAVKLSFPYHKHTKVENLISFINKNSAKTDKITVVGNDCWIYLLSGRESVSKYAYQFPLVMVDKYGEMIAENYWKKIENEKPRIIITRLSDGQNKYLPKLNEMLNTQYDPVTLTDLEEWNIYCWLRKK
jgi:hypothetical protein